MPAWFANVDGLWVGRLPTSLGQEGVDRGQVTLELYLQNWAAEADVECMFAAAVKGKWDDMFKCAKLVLTLDGTSKIEVWIFICTRALKWNQMHVSV